MSDDADYLKLLRGLREALDGWEQWVINYPDKDEQARIKRLRLLLSGTSTGRARGSEPSIEAEPR